MSDFETKFAPLNVPLNRVMMFDAVISVDLPELPTLPRIPDLPALPNLPELQR
jgi:hypothetical protein